LPNDRNNDRNNDKNINNTKQPQYEKGMFIKAVITDFHLIKNFKNKEIKEINNNNY
jgi:hypothetical protein